MSGFNAIMVFVLLFCQTQLTTARASDKKIKISERVERYLKESEKNDFAGAFLLAQKGDILLSKGYGNADRKNKIPITPDTVFDIGSVTKQFTAAAILKLVERKRIKLTDTLGQHFKGVPIDKKDITLHQLLTHSSGISSHTGDDYEKISSKNFLNQIWARPLNFEPGTQYEYANAGYSLLGILVEEVSGQEFELFLQQTLFKPAGMQNTGYVIPDWTKRKLAIGYDSAGHEWGTSLNRWRDQGVSWHLKANGGLFSTVGDLYKWHLALESNSVLPRYLKTLYETPYVPENVEGESYYGYGWAIYKTAKDTKLVTHNGSNGIFFTDFHRLVDEDIVIIFMTNSYSMDVEELAWNVNQIVFDESFVPKAIRKPLLPRIYQFISTKKPSDISHLTPLLFKHEETFKNKPVLNRIGLDLVRGREVIRSTDSLPGEALTQKQRWVWGIAILTLNTALFPTDGNLWDSLAEGYRLGSRNEQAIAAYRKALSLKPKSGQCYWCRNAKKALRALEQRRK